MQAEKLSEEKQQAKAKELAGETKGSDVKGQKYQGRHAKMRGLFRTLVVIFSVYLAFRYLLGLVLPFLLGLFLACLMEKPVCFLERRVHLKRVLAVLLVLAAGSVLLSFLCYGLAVRVAQQLGTILKNYDSYYLLIHERLSGICCKVDGMFGFAGGESLSYLDENLNALAERARTGLMPAIMGSSIPTLVKVLTFVATAVVAVTAAVFISCDMKTLKKLFSHPLYGEDLSRFAAKFKSVLVVYFKTQFILFAIITAECVAGFSLMKNPYALVVGIAVGILDAFPFLGTGTVLIPWALVLLLFGNAKTALWLLVIYLISYLTREWLEPRLMGNRLGISPLGMLFSIYAGLKLFGIGGIILGPIAFFMIQEIVKEV